MAQSFTRLDDDAIRSLVGAQTFAEATALYEAGGVFACEQEPGRSLTAMVTRGADAVEAKVFQQNAGLYAQCECGRARPEVCEHVAALLIAWSRAPDSFAEVDDGEDDEDDEEEAGPAKRGLRPAEATGGSESRGAASAAVPLAAEPHPSVRREDPLYAEYARGLDGLTIPQLRELAERRGITVSGNRKGPILQTLAAALARRGALAELWPSLTRAAHFVLSALCYMLTQSGVYMPHVRDAVRQFDAEAAAGFDDAVAELIRLGLVFRTPYNALDCPASLAAELPPDPDFLPPAPGTHTPRQAAHPYSFALFATRMLLTLRAEGTWRARQAVPPHPLARQFGMAGAWPYEPAELDDLARQPDVRQSLYGALLSVPVASPPLDDPSRESLARGLDADPAQIDFAVRLLANLRLVRLTPGEPVTVDDARATDFLRRNPLGRAISLYQAWVGLQQWTELDLSAGEPEALRLKHAGIMGTVGTYETLLGALAMARQYLLGLIRRAPPGTWTEFSMLVGRVRALRTNAAIWPLGSSGWVVEIGGQRAVPTDKGYWRTVYGAYARAVLAGPMSWMGLVELPAGGSEPAAFRLTELGEVMLQQRKALSAAPVPAETGPSLAFTPDGELRLRVEAADPELIVLLSHLCSARGDGQGGLLYRPTTAGVTRALEQGWDVPGLLARLERAAGAPVPAALAAQLNAWSERFGAVHLYRDIALVELADDFALSELLAGTSLSRHLLYRFSPRLIAVRPEGVEEWRAELVKKGYTPTVEAP